MNDWLKAGKLAAQAREYAQEVCVAGKSYTYIVDTVEDFIIKRGGFPAFPMDISVNHVAAHYCPFIDDPEENIVKKGDVIKLDIGVHINGAVADNACTVEIGTNKWAKLIRASKEACLAACDLATPGRPIYQLGAIVEDTIRSHGFNPITNLSGHGVGLWQVHTAPAIPNYDNGNKKTLVEGQYIAIEPFATDGIGSVSEGKPCGVYGFLQKKPVRLPGARKLMGHIEKTYNTLPFTERWLKDTPNIKFLLALLEREGVIKQYTILPEKKNGMVTQHENTIEIGTGITTKI